MLGAPLQSGEVALAEGETPLPRLDGTLRLILSRYLHLESDLVWREPLPSYLAGMLPVEDIAASEVAITGEEQVAAPAALEGDEAMMSTEAETLSELNYQVFRMKQSRRMRSNEVHYIDHPLFGIIALVTRYELPQPETTEAAAQQP
jgi:hypothetical protein